MRAFVSESTYRIHTAVNDATYNVTRMMSDVHHCLLTLASSSGEGDTPTGGWAPSCCAPAAPSPRLTSGRCRPNALPNEEPRSLRPVVVSASMDFLDSWSSFLSRASLSFSRLSMSPWRISMVLLNFLQRGHTHCVTCTMYNVHG